MRKRIGRVCMMLVLMFGLFSTAYTAYANDDYSHYTCYCEQNGGSQGPNGYSCARDNGAYIYSTTHHYGLFLRKTCTKKVYQATTVVGCGKCGYVYGFAGNHECYVIHQNCDDGKESVCTIGHSLPGYDPWRVKNDVQGRGSGFNEENR